LTGNVSGVYGQSINSQEFTSHDQYSKNVNDNNTSQHLNVNSPITAETSSCVSYQNSLNNMSSSLNENKSTIGGWKQSNLNQQNFYQVYDQQQNLQTNFNSSTKNF